MKTIRNIIPLLACFFFSATLFAQQTVEFEYDETGNRILRQLYIGKSTDAVVDSLFKDINNHPTMIGDHLVKVYPNPTMGKINIEFLEMSEETTTYFITDQNGKQIMNGENSKLLNIIDVTHQGGGVYYLVIKAPEIYQVYKIIKQ